MHGAQQVALKVGCCGYPVSRATYFQEFSLVELQQTFYQLPRVTTAQKWRQEAPEGFAFCLKAWQGITHPADSPTYRKAKLTLEETEKQELGFFRPTRPVWQAWEDTLAVATALEAKVIVFQCPPSFREEEKFVSNLEQFFSHIKRGSFKLAIEFRAPWSESTIQRLCQQFDLLHCVDPFKEPALGGPWRYYRLHGSPPGPRMYRYKYTPRDLEFLLEVVKKDLSQGLPVYCLFNNLSMWQDARAFRKLAQEKLGNLYSVS